MDYQRLVSYIYSYPEGVKGRNVGFAKALVHQGQFKLSISLRGVKTDSPEMFGIYMMVTDGGYRLIKLGECLVKMGQMEYSGVFNPDNINETGYGFKDICGLAVAREDARYDCMLSMWKDEDVTPDMLVFSGMDAKKQVEAGIVIKERMRQSEEKERGQQMSESVLAESLRSEPVRPELAESQMAQAEPAVSAGRPQTVQSKQAEAYRPQTGVTAESVSDTATEDIKAAGAAAKIPAETQHLQKEVADRMQCGPGTKDYGALSLAVQFYAKPKVVLNVPASCFMPRPNVDSAVIRLERFKTPPVDVKNEHLMFKIIRASFNQRRKTMLNSVGDSGIGITKEALTNALETMGLPLTIRGEALTLKQFAELSNLLG